MPTWTLSAITKLESEFFIFIIFIFIIITIQQCMFVSLTGDTDDGIVTRSVMYLFDQMQKATSGCKYTFRSESTRQCRMSTLPREAQSQCVSSCDTAQHLSCCAVAFWKGRARQPVFGLLFHQDFINIVSLLLLPLLLLLLLLFLLLQGIIL